ncbi:hypothetical protein N7528_003616 [Penicillium herquei]|nr:hypothetical protein N7528_003616 [Penicillium herquei]
MSRTSPPNSEATIASLFAGPGSASNSSSSIDETVVFRFVLERTVQVLSSHKLPDSGRLYGLLFVPELDADDPCNEITKPFIPENVTRYGNVSEFGYGIVALAPWVSPECTQSFLAVARELETAAVVFFEPKSNDTGLPPSPNSDRWDLNDQGRWRLDNSYPVYAIPGPAGVTLMNELSWFPSDSSSHASPSHQNSTSPSSTDVSSSPNSRIFIMADTGKWLMDGIQHCSQSHEHQAHGHPYRRFLPHRNPLDHLGTEKKSECNEPCAGPFGLPTSPPATPLPPHPAPQNEANPQNEVDVEYHALNRLKVPRHIVEAMPTFIYPGPAEASATHSMADNHAPGIGRQDQTLAPSITPVAGIRRPEAAHINPGHDGHVPSSNAGSSWSRESGQYNNIEDQDQCSICLEPFLLGETTVRQLPCGHIFNPGCIDQHLMHQSSLCPLCRRSVL